MKPSSLIALVLVGTYDLFFGGVNTCKIFETPQDVA